MFSLQSASEGCIDHFTQTLSRETEREGSALYSYLFVEYNIGTRCVPTRALCSAYNAHVNTSSPDSTMHNHMNLQVKWRDTPLFKLCKCKNMALSWLNGVFDNAFPYCCPKTDCRSATQCQLVGAGWVGIRNMGKIWVECNVVLPSLRRPRPENSIRTEFPAADRRSAAWERKSQTVQRAILL